MTKLNATLLSTLIIAFSPFQAWAEYFEPPKIRSITFKGVKFKVVKDPLRGLFRAIDVHSGKVLYEITLYKVELKPNFEVDSQYVFLTSMHRKGDKLYFTDQGNRLFEFDIPSQTARLIPKKP